MSLNRKLFYNLQTFWGFFQVHFYDFVANSAWKWFSTYTSRHRRGKVNLFLVICLCDWFIYRSNFVLRKCLETRRHLGSGHKTVNSQGYSEFWELIKTREKLLFTDLVNTKIKSVFSYNIGQYNNSQPSSESVSSRVTELEAKQKKWKIEGWTRRRGGNACPKTPRFWKTPLDISRVFHFANWHFVNL